MLPQEVLNEVVLVRHTVVVRRQVVTVTHHGLKPSGLAVQILHRGDLAAEDAVIAVLLQLSGKHQAGAIEREHVEVVHQDCYTHALAKDLHRFNVGERTGTHAEGDNIERAGHGVTHHHVSERICHPLLEGQTLSGSSPACQKLEHTLCSMS